MNEHERGLRMTAAESTAVVQVLGQVLSRLALLGPHHETAIREGPEAAAEDLAIEASRPVGPPLTLDYGPAARITRLLSHWALFECDVRASVARGETSWPAPSRAPRRERDR